MWRCQQLLFQLQLQRAQYLPLWLRRPFFSPRGSRRMSTIRTTWTTRVHIVDSDGIEHTAEVPNSMIDRPCVVCETLHSGMNFLPMSGTFFCNDCWYKMGMRAVGGGAYAHLGPDVLFIGNQANISACPTHDPDFGVCTPFAIIQKVKEKPHLRHAIDECLGEHGRAITNENLQDECTAILELIDDKQFESLVSQGKL